jgi:hypothetical protein
MRSVIVCFLKARYFYESLRAVSVVFCFIHIELWTSKRRFGRVGLSQCKFEGYGVNYVQNDARDPAGRSVGLVTRLKAERSKNCEFHSFQGHDCSCLKCPYGGLGRTGRSVYIVPIKSMTINEYTG